eukprot:TRINITY_DN64097_c0_g1_i1.p1 TRINITY_DN64097_c0_g1~~TRINITY_DN64097_c0_g1_i1.p1  ORF type:complete len:149 (-),score=46.97 TRINITY_DN64097_c0_g1_i1:91-537(-)
MLYENVTMQCVYNSCYHLRAIVVFFFKQKTAYEMLRSLVGSEMCIRDRLRDEAVHITVGGAQLAAAGTIVQRVEVLHGKGAPRLRRLCGLLEEFLGGLGAAGEVDGDSEQEEEEEDVLCCLLYTSDAADEEDSVGLGGRRIIITKKVL